MKRFFIVLAASLTAVSLAACGSGNATADTKVSGNYLKVGVRTNLANFSTYDEAADTYYGFEDDVAKTLAYELGYDGVEYVGLDPAERDQALENGSIDCLIAAYSKTDEREEKFDLSLPYYYDEGRVMIEKSTLFEDYADLKGAKVAVRTGTTAAENFAAKLCEKGLIADSSEAALAGFLDIIEFDAYADMNAALEAGEVDAICADGCITLPWLDDERTYFEEAYSEEEYVVATVKDSGLSEKIDEAISSMTESGEIDTIAVKWGV